MGSHHRAPSYYFTIEALRADPNSPQRHDQRNYWLPPKRLGSNSKIRANSRFYNNGASTVVQAFSENGVSLDEFQAHQTFSIYHSRSVLWAINYDATMGPVGDGLHSQQEDMEVSAACSDVDDEEDLQPYDDWRELSFRRAEDPSRVVSVAGPRLPESRLIGHRDDQDWVFHFLPDRYHCRTTTGTHGDGGLVGSLALLIGLVAMSMRPDEWPIYIPQTMSGGGAGQWQVSQAQIQAIPRGNRWLDKKGIVVTVYLDPTNTSEQVFSRYESGAYGPILT